MNKLLLAIIPLCFSVAANADIYICESKNFGEGYVDGLHKSLPYAANLIVDTDKGFILKSGFTRTGHSEYAGTCNQGAEYLTCSYTRENFDRADLAIKLASRTNNYRFTFTQNVYAERVNFYTGTCTRA